MEEELRKIWELPCKSQEFMVPPNLTHREGEVVLTYDYETETGEYSQSSILFRGVEAFSFTSYESCLPEQVAAYDKVMMVTKSRWLNELCARWAIEKEPVHHYRVFFDEIGCYEVIASEFCGPGS